MTTRSGKKSLFIILRSHDWYIRRTSVRCINLACRGNSALVRIQDMSVYSRWSVHVTQIAVIPRTEIVAPDGSLPCSQQPATQSSARRHNRCLHDPHYCSPLHISPHFSSPPKPSKPFSSPTRTIQNCWYK
jgi:hypothetical protein